MEFLTSLDNYNIFYEVAKCKNITKASEKLFISQPAVSQAIKKLEENLGANLIVRLKKGIELTPLGQKIFEKVELGLNNLLAIEALINEEKGLISGELKIGSGSNIARKILCEHVCEFIKKYPSVNVEMSEGVQSQMLAKLKTGELDFVITQKNEDINLQFIPMFNTKYCFVKSKNCLADKFVLISEGSFTHELFISFIKKNGLEKTPVVQVAGYKTALELVKRRIGTTLLPKYIVQDLLDENVLEVVYENYALPTITFGAYYNKNLQTPAAKKFMEYLYN
ncbi:MAG: LysR family transcriptional regulator [Clostridiales bacterium]|nr:LysR family transcriptional regulator [Clostridiales bacterium]